MGGESTTICARLRELPDSDCQIKGQGNRGEKRGGKEEGSCSKERKWEGGFEEKKSLPKGETKKGAYSTSTQTTHALPQGGT